MGLSFIKETEPGTYVGLWKVEESVEELEQRLILNKEEKEYFRTLRKNKRNLHWLGSRVLLRTMIRTPHFIELQNDPDGKPYLVNFDHEISLSHSFDFAAAMLSHKKVGIDIEMLRPRINKIKERFLHPLELEHLGRHAETEQLFVYWCAKEALFKLYGKKPLSFRKNILIEPFEISGGGVVHGRFIDSPSFPDSYFPVSYEKHNGYMMAYVSDLE